MAITITGLYGDTGLVTLNDIATKYAQKGDMTMKRIVELQAQTNNFWGVIGMKECNDGTKEKVLLRTKLPDLAWRMLNRGVKTSKSGSKEVTYTTGGVEAYAVVDERLMEMNGYSNDFRLSENMAYQHAMSNEMSQTFFYGDENVNPAGFTGLSAHYYKKADLTSDDVWGKQIVDAGGTGSKLSSLWICTFSPDTVYGITPKGIPAGYRYRDNARVPITNDKGEKFYAYESQYNWDFGLCIRDPRYVVRLANIDLTNRDDTEFVDKLIDAYNRIENVDKGRTFIMCNRNVQTYLAILAAKKQNVNLTVREFGGAPIEHFWSSPILRCDALLNTESQVM